MYQEMIRGELAFVGMAAVLITAFGGSKGFEKVKFTVLFIIFKSSDEYEYHVRSWTSSGYLTRAPISQN